MWAMSRSTMKSKEIISIGHCQIFGIKLQRIVFNGNENRVTNCGLLLLNQRYRVNSDVGMPGYRRNDLFLKIYAKT